ncbi:hypothetical protein DFQ04_2761 [Algoriphagus boseongensis]|uniref:Tetratricopeptide repeat protein n=1 Tax=Algoriphagus boseongensis TaxID=1442587 RepID=A0A4R6T5P9_9BACT|nr:hypothetical protein [Algoriphagus boseongensis]TDQ16639.1 hypothetical protein DFQ04_2761 [Algoriphagus boseongensis]
MKSFRLLLLGIALAYSCKEKSPEFQAPLLENLGAYEIQVSTKSAYAQQFFNQGIIMANNFNHAEAERSFREAVRLDTDLAMGYWGIAYVLGPNFNSEASMGTVEEIRNAVAKAVSLLEKVSPWEKGLIKAIQIKFPETNSTSDDEGFSQAMKQVHEDFPDNSFVATLYAESLMNLHPWDFYEGRGGAPRPWTPEIVTLLEKVLEIDTKNPLANHLYLHATEASGNLEKALEVAERLKNLVPAAGHLVHMPSHIYINTGDYHEGSLANERAVLADSIYIAQCQAQGYYPQMYYTHNYHFLAATAAFEGRAARSIEAAYQTAGLVDPAYYFEPGFEMVQHYLTIPNHILVKFAQWEKILALPKPSEDLIYPRAIWHYARGMALANLGRTQEAYQELDSLNILRQDTSIENQLNWGINKVTEVCQIASNVLNAKLKADEGKKDEAIALLYEAIAVEDQLNYTEPPDWFFSVRHVLGNLLLAKGDFIQAEKIFREDLFNWPKNGFALNGLAESLKAQGKLEEGEEASREFQESWKLADIELKGSEVDPEKRKDMALTITSKSPNSLVLLAASFCGPN